MAEPETPVEPERIGAKAMFSVAVVLQVIVLYDPTAPQPPTVPWWDWAPAPDKVLHMAVFALVAWTGRQVGIPVRTLVFWLAVQAVVSELAQARLLPERNGDVVDLVADLVGIGIGAVLPLPRRRRTKAAP